MIIVLDFATKRISTMDGTPTVGVDEPPIAETALLTSHPYPLEVVEGLDGSALPTNGRIFGNPDDAIDAGATFVSGVLTVTAGYVSHDATPEAIDGSVTFLSGALTVVTAYWTHNTEEALDASAAFLSGDLRLALVSTSTTESLDASATFIGGTLS